MSAQDLNGDLSQPVSVRTSAMDWSASPSGTVWRKRVHRVGPAESGQVTSLVRYQAGASFPGHDHPEGEEILVLEGVFSDEHGDWPAGTYLLNPEGFHHAPFSRQGCLLWVKLRQYPGLDRLHLETRSHTLPWQQGETTERTLKPLYDQPSYSDNMRLENWDSHLQGIELHWPGGVELFVISGDFNDASGEYDSGSWLRLPPGSNQLAGTRKGCELYIKEGGFSYLRGT